MTKCTSRGRLGRGCARCISGLQHGANAEAANTSLLPSKSRYLGATSCLQYSTEQKQHVEWNISGSSNGTATGLRSPSCIFLGSPLLKRSVTEAPVDRNGRQRQAKPSLAWQLPGYVLLKLSNSSLECSFQLRLREGDPPLPSAWQDSHLFRLTQDNILDHGKTGHPFSCRLSLKGLPLPQKSRTKGHLLRLQTPVGRGRPPVCRVFDVSKCAQVRTKPWPNSRTSTPNSVPLRTL